MADVVQYKLERMLTELDDLERRGLFIRREIAEIVKQRRRFEYRLKRPSPLKQDFLAYIDYEKQLDALRLLRKKSLLKKTGAKKSKKSVSDFACVAKILDIYRLATTRFKGDIELWFKYLEFCKARRNGRMKKALGQIVNLHPKVPSVWIYAAAWEFDTNLNVTAARSLMLSGLRMCPSSQDLWVEYLRMELTYLTKLKARKVALGEIVENEQWKKKNKESFMPMEDEDTKNNLQEDEDDDAKINLQEDEEPGSTLDVDRQSLSVLETIYSQAIEALPTAFDLRTQFLDILEANELAGSEEMRGKILSDMKKDFSEEVFYWDWLARYEVRANPKQLGKAVEVYEEGLKFVPSASMIELYVKYLMDRVNDGEANVDFESDGNADNIVSQLRAVFDKAESMGCLTEDLACQHVSLLLNQGKSDDAKMLIEKLCSGKFQDAVQLWTLRISMEMKCIENKSVSPSKGDLQCIFELLRNVLKRVNVAEAENLWTMGLKYFANQRRHFRKLVETSILVLTKDGGSDSGFSLSSTILSFILQRDGVESAREMYKRFLALPHPGLSIFRNCIELESNLASTGDKTGLANARKLYESALATYDQDASIWLDYHSLEVKLGSSESAAAVHWRARKALKDSSALVVNTNS